MVTISNLRDTLKVIGFIETEKEIFVKRYPHFNQAELRVDFNAKLIIYPEDKGLKVWDKTSSGNFNHPENFVVLECVTRLLDKGYRPEHIELEKRWQLGRGASGGKADICVTDETGEKMLLIIECKTAGKEYNDAIKKMREDGGQLFSYWQQERSTQWIALYCSDMKDGEIHYENIIVKCTDDNNILKMAEKDKSQLTYRRAHTAEELVETWKETYSQATHSNLIFGYDTVAYKIGIKPLLKRDLNDFTPDDKIVNRFEEILRHNNVSDKENAFNRLIALFICKLVDEIQKNDWDEVDFQYKMGTDTYESLQDRLQRLHQIGMKDFMQEEINYIDDEYAERVFSQLKAGNRKKAIEDLRNTIRILKYYTNNDFSFKDVHNEELFYQNGKILVEVVQLFEPYRIVYSSKHQFLGDLFEQLLSKGFKQNEGQFFTPTPITRFIWDCMPLDKVLHQDDSYHLPRIIDYACGAGHFLTEAVEAINDYFHVKDNDEQTESNLWVEKNVYGVEKDYRLARVAKVCLYMNGAGKGQIVFGDGLEQYQEKGITNGTFDILVANPPYSVDSFKAHLKLKNNTFELLPRISNDGGEIETLFVERIAQLLRPKGVAAVILPSSILSNDSSSYIGAREQLLKNFNLRAVAQFGSKTFGATGTNTVVLFLEKYCEPPKRKEQLEDSVTAILANEAKAEWEDKEILDAYLQKIQVSEENYTSFLQHSLTLDQLKDIPYFSDYVALFLSSTKLRTLQKSQRFRRLSTMSQTEEILKLFYSEQQAAEREKLYYFALVYKQTTLIISAPQSNDEQKRFLGYDWSNRRGSEGIQINTPGGMLYNDGDRFALGTLAAAVRHSYNEMYTTIPEREQFYTFARLQDMIEFTRPIFNKAIKLTPERKIVIKSRYPLVKLGTIAYIQKGKSITKADAVPGDVKVVAGGTDYAYMHNIANRAANTITISASGANAGYVNLWKEPIFASDCTTVRGKNDLHTFFIFNFLQSIQEQIYYLQKGAAQPHVYPDDIAALQIPQVDDVLMKKIVAECQKVDEEYNASRMAIEEYRRRIKQVFENMQVMGGGKQLKLSDIGVIRMCKRIMKHETNTESGVPFYKIGTFGGEADAYISQDLFDTYKSQYPYPTKGQVLISAAGTLGKTVAFDGKPAYFQDSNIVWIDNDETKVLNAFLLWAIRFVDWSAYITDGSVIPRIYNESMRNVTITVPSLSEQKKTIAKVEQYEQMIKDAQAIMAQCANRKKAVLSKYL